MLASQIRQEAREKLTNKWGKGALITLIYFLIIFGISFVSGILSIIPLIGLLITLGIYAITVPLSYGYLISMVRLVRDEEVEVADFLSIGFSKFTKVWGVVGNTLLKLLLPLILVFVFLFMITMSLGAGVVSSVFGNSYGFAAFSLFSFIGFVGYLVSLIFLIIKGYLYSLSYLILNDHPEMSGKEIVEESERLMTNHRWNLFYLFLTFIGWAILSIFTLYIGLLWLIPYVTVALIMFYEHRRNDISEVIASHTKTEKKIVEVEAAKENIEKEVVVSEEISEVKEEVITDTEELLPEDPKAKDSDTENSTSDEEK